MYLNFLSLDDARKTFQIFDKKLGVLLPEKNYAEDCRFFTPDHPESIMYNFMDAVIDVHFVAHLAGWFVKVLVLRDVIACWIASITFELCELTF